jgi:hypothetical protein
MVSRDMQKRTFIIFLSVATVIALTAIWFWAIAPLVTPLISINSNEFTSADVVRRVWHFRLVQPEWVSTTNYVRWTQVESLIRSILVVLGWSVGVAFVIRRHSSSHRGAPSDAPSQPMAAVH